MTVRSGIVTLTQVTPSVARRVGPTGRGWGRDAILAVTVEMLESVGESGVRVGAIADAAGVGIGLINYHFGSRDGLLAAAQLVRFSTQIDQELDHLGEQVSNARNRDDVVELMGQMMRGLVAANQVESRLGRIDALGAAHGRPTLLTEIGEVQTRLRERLGVMFRDLQSFGHVRSDVDADALATLFLSLSVGLVIYDVEAKPCPRDTLIEALDVFVDRCVVVPASARRQRP